MTKKVFSIFRKGHSTLSPQGRCNFVRLRRKTSFISNNHVAAFATSFQKDLSDKGVPIEQIRELAGHDSIQTTAIYVQASGRDLHKAVSKI